MLRALRPPVAFTRGIERPGLLAGVLVLCGLLAFLPNVRGYFLADDFVLLSWTRPASVPSVAAFFDPATEWFYRPFVKVVYSASQGLFGMNPLPLHLFSVIAHGLNAFLLYRLVSREAGGDWRAGLAAALVFLLNRHHAETVSWIAAVGDLLAAACILSSLLLFRRYLRSGRLLPLAGSLAVFAAGLFTRETAVMLPLLLLVYVAMFSGLPPGRTRLPRLGALAGALAAYGVVLLAYVGVSTSGGLVERGGLAFRALNFDSILLGIMDYVHGLVPGGGRVAALPLDTLRWVAWVEGLVLVVLAVLLWRARQGVALFGLAWMVVSPLLFVFFSPPTDRYFYLPSIGFAVLVGALAARLAAVRNGRAPMGLVGARRVLAAGLVVALLVWQAAGLVRELQAWRLAGEMTGGFFADVKEAEPEPRDYTAFFFTGLPPVVGSVPVFQNSLPHAVQLMYENETIAASSVTCEYLRAQEELPRYSLFFRIEGTRAEAFTDAASCR